MRKTFLTSRMFRLANWKILAANCHSDDSHRHVKWIMASALVRIRKTDFSDVMRPRSVGK
jgi:hypothetical protein